MEKNNFHPVFLTAFCGECGESRWVIYFLRWMWRLIFVRNAVKCGEIFIFTAFTAITAFLTKIHRFHRISYKNIPKNLDPGRNLILLNKIWTLAQGLLMKPSHGFASNCISTVPYHDWGHATHNLLRFATSQFSPINEIMPLKVFLITLTDF